MSDVADFSRGAAYLDGAYVPIADAKIAVGDWGFVHSDVTDDVVHVRKLRFFRLEDHLDRFQRSLAGDRPAPPVSRDEMRFILARCKRRTTTITTGRCCSISTGMSRKGPASTCSPSKARVV